MAGSTLGNLFTITTWGESHGAAIGVVIDGCPAGLSLDEEDIQIYLDRRKPGQSRFTTARKESDKARILSGVFEGHTTGTPISIMVENTDQRSRDYGKIKDCYRPVLPLSRTFHKISVSISTLIFTIQIMFALPDLHLCFQVPE